MLSSVYIALLLLAYLTSTVISHAVWNRLARSNAAPQGRALRIVVIQLLLFAAVGSWGARRYAPLASMPYVGICLACFGYCYWSLICLSESGRRYQIVFLVASGRARNIGDLRTVYSSAIVVQQRLLRLEQWAEVIRTDGRVVCAGGPLFRVSQMVYLWARLLRFHWF